MLSRLIISVVCIVLFGVIALYNNKILASLDTFREKLGIRYYKLFGGYMKETNTKLTRYTQLNKKGTIYKVYAFFEDIIINHDLRKDNVTVAGLLIFIVSISLSGGMVLGYVMSSMVLVGPITMAFAYLIITVFRLTALIKYEQREAEIMDAEDLMVSDIAGGVYNAIVRYQDSFHVNIRHHFINFIDDVQNKGYSFKQAMQNLEQGLGGKFSDFAQKAILYEDKADETMDDIFSSIIETNRQRRTLRYANNQKFAELRTQFIFSLTLILGYAIFTTLVDPFIVTFLTKNLFGKLMLIGDIVIVAWVLSYMAAVKAKTL